MPSESKRAAWLRWLSAGIDVAVRNPVEIVEVFCVLAVLRFLIFYVPDGVTLALFRTIAGTFHSAVVLLRVDGKATLPTLCLAFLKLLIGAVPLLCVTLRARSAARWLLAFRLPLVGVVFPFSCFACATRGQWIALILIAAAASWLSAYRSIQWLWVAPLVLLASPSQSHLLRALGGLDTTMADQMNRCRANSGLRPSNLRPNDVGTIYYGLTLKAEDEALLTGVDNSLWLRRRGREWLIDGSSQARGVLSSGCLLGRTLWTTKSKSPLEFVSISRAADGAETVDWHPVPSGDTDLGYLACRPDGRVFTSDVFASHVWEISGHPPRVRRLKGSLGGWRTHLQLLPNGMLAARDTSGFSIYSPEKEEVVQRQAASVMGWAGPAVCAQNGELAITDILGRVRFFSRDGQGDYQFSGGVSVFAPRYAAYSPDCRYLAVASGDDQTVYLIDRATMTVLHSYQAGLWISDVVFTGAREFAVVDACTMTSIMF